ncbi:MAG: DUF6625 family protein, partial [Sphingobacteriales bacterium]
IDTYLKPLPANVKFVYKTLNDISNIAAIKLGFPVNIGDPYKLCDFKPAYGLLFSELLTGYDFWGQSDIDVIYGNIRGFITDDLLSEFDFISIRHDYTSGCFALYKNNPFVNNLFKRSKDYLKVFTGNKHYCFDECNFVHTLLEDGESIFNIETEIESFTHIIKAADSNHEIKAHFDFILVEGVTGKVMFDKGRIIYKRKFEGILYHLFWLKRIYNPKKGMRNIPETYYISPTKIYRKPKSKITVNEF